MTFNSDESLPPIPPGPSPPTPGDDPYEVLKIPSVRLYLTGRFIASIGQQMLTVAIGWELYERTHSALALGMVGLTYMIPMLLFTLPAGHVADNFDRKRVVMMMCGLMIAASLGLFWVSLTEAPLYWIYLCLFVAGSARTFLWPASSSFLPQLVPRRIFPRAVAWSMGTFQLSSVTGPALGGAVIAINHHAAPVYLLNALAVLICLILVRKIQHQSAPIVRQPMTLASLVAGFQFVFGSRILLGIITLDMFAVLLGGANALMPIYAKDILHVGPIGLGFLEAGMPVGSLLSALFLAHRPLQKAGRALLWSVAAFGMATIIFGFSKIFLLSWFMLFVCGVTDNVSVVVRHTLVQLLTPDEKRGRVSAVNSLFIGTSNELGGFESGMVAHWFGPVASVVSGGAGTILVVLAVAWIWPEVRRYGKLEPPD